VTAAFSKDPILARISEYSSIILYRMEMIPKTQKSLEILRWVMQASIALLFTLYFLFNSTLFAFLREIRH